MQIDDRDGADGDADGPSLLPQLPHRLCRPSLCPFASVLLPHEYICTAIFAARLQKRSKFLALLGNFLYIFYLKLPQAAMSLGWCWRQTRSLCRFQPCSRTKVRVVRFHLRGDPVIFFGPLAFLFARSRSFAAFQTRKRLPSGEKLSFYSDYARESARCLPRPAFSIAIGIGMALPAPPHT